MGQWRKWRGPGRAEEQRRSRGEREASLGARSPVMVMELRGGSGVTQANIEGETFVLDGVNVAASESVEDVATGESDASSCAKGLWGTTTGGATAG